MKGQDFIFDCVHLLYYQCHKINFKRGGSYIDSPDSIKNKKRKTINPTRITNNMQRITETKPFIDTYNEGGRNYPSKKDNSKKSEKKINDYS